MGELKQSVRQTLKPDSNGVRRLGIFVNGKSENLFYSHGNDGAANRVKPNRVWLDEEGFICVEMLD